MNNFDTLLANIDRNSIYPPPRIEEVLNYFNSRRPMCDYRRYHAYEPRITSGKIPQDKKNLDTGI
ncbi:10242_t:CDS:2 [Diversispora eburnea]|uniref:10242_t:CDS:1 n=1 Tax=Diversispora eburnea TaxID=1213867 RepID=A0A9N9BMM6_9GLOM|nr:10242_t:CDS:2 [Diversispora eburnea]